MGAFITFEGLDGCGKSTQLELLAQRLRAPGRELITTREPGGTPLGERIRALVLGDAGAGAQPAAATELALMCASRAQSVAELIAPALARGAWVLCDRFHDATEAYQGGGRGLDRGVIRDLHRHLCADLQPDLTLILDLDAAASLKRARRRLGAPPAEGRFERENDAFFAAVAAAYREIAAREPARCRLIAATGSVEAVAARVWAAAAGLRPREE